MRRIVLLVVATLVAWLGLGITGPVHAALPVLVQTYAYDVHDTSANLIRTATERGPPATCDNGNADHADCLREYASARLSAGATRAAYVYEDHSRSVQIATSRPEAEEHASTAAAVPVVVLRSDVAAKAANSGSRALVDAGKYDYLFGRVASGSHNAARSAQNAQQLARVGVHDNAAGRSLLSNHFDDVIARNDNIARTFTNEHGTFQIRDSLFSGPGGFLKFESTWQVTDDGFRLTTVIPMGGP